MVHPVFPLLLAACLSTGALAQDAVQAVGVVESGDGLLTLSQNNTQGSLAAGSGITNGTLVANTSTSSAVIRLANGCGIGLGQNQSVTIDTSLDCNAQRNNVQSVDNVPLTTGSGQPLPPGEGLAIGLRQRQNSSGS